MDQLEAYKANLEKLKMRKAQVEVQLKNCTTTAADLKKKMQAMGYENLNAAKEDYARRTSDLVEKAKMVDSLLKQIDAVEASMPSKDDILEQLRKGVEVVEQPNQRESITEKVAPELSVEDKQEVTSKESEEPSLDDNLFADMESLGL